MNIVISSLIFILGLATFFWMNKDKKNFRFDIDEVHHAYFGWLIAWILPLHHRLLPLWLYLPLLFVGFLMFFDDVSQHHMQSYDPNFQSWLHKLLRFFRWVW
jgi:amino acid permease